MKKNREIFNQKNTKFLIGVTIASIALIASVASLIILDLALPIIISLCVTAFLSAVVTAFSVYAILKNSNILKTKIDINNNTTANQITKIEFSQHDIMNVARDNHEKYPLTTGIIKKFNGLCDVLCNYVTEHNLLQDMNSAEKLQRNEHINILKELEARTVHSHILKASSLMEKILAFLFGIYPCNILTYCGQLRIVNYNNNIKSYHINEKIFRKNFSSLSSGSYIKFCTFKLTLTQFSGHSMLIRKNVNNYFTFFDPNDGIRFYLTLDELAAVLNEKISCNYNGIVFIDNIKFLNKTKHSLDQKNSLTDINISTQAREYACG